MGYKYRIEIYFKPTHWFKDENVLQTLSKAKAWALRPHSTASAKSVKIWLDN